MSADLTIPDPFGKTLFLKVEERRTQRRWGKEGSNLLFENFPKKNLKFACLCSTGQLSLNSSVSLNVLIVFFLTFARCPHTLSPPPLCNLFSSLSKYVLKAKPRPAMLNPQIAHHSNL